MERTGVEGPTTSLFGIRQPKDSVRQDQDKRRTQGNGKPKQFKPGRR